MKGGGRIYRRTFADTHARAAVRMLYDRSKIGANGSRTNGICERFHRTVEGEFHDIAFRKKLYRSVEALQTYLGCLAGQIQRSETAFRKILPWQDTCADPPRNAAHCRGQDRKTVNASEPADSGHPILGNAS